MTTTTAIISFFIISIIFIAGLYLIDIFDEALLPASSSASIDIKDKDGDIKTENDYCFEQITFSDNTTNISSNLAESTNLDLNINKYTR